MKETTTKCTECGKIVNRIPGVWSRNLFVCNECIEGWLSKYDR